MIACSPKYLLFLLLVIGSCHGHASSAERVYPLHLEQDRWAGYAQSSLRDSEGFLWIATDNSLKRYDGYQLRSFAYDAEDPGSVGSRSVTRLTLRTNGEFWVAGAQLSRYNAETETFTTYPIGDDVQIHSIHEDQQGFLWLGGWGIGLLKFDPGLGKVTHRFLETGEKSFTCCVTQQGATSNIWVGSELGISLFDTETHTVEHFPLPLDLGDGPAAIRGMTEDYAGNLWIATRNGLLVFDIASKTFRQYLTDSNNPRSLATNLITTVMRDSRGQIWIGTDKNGVHKYNPATDDFEHSPASAFDLFRFPPGSVTHIHEDSEGTLWFTMGHYGVFRMSPPLQKFIAYQHSFDSDNSLAFNNVLDIYQDRSGIIWIGTDGGGLERLDPKTNNFTHYRHNPDDSESLGNDTVLAIAEDSTGYIWIGTWGAGLSRLDPGTGKFTHVQQTIGARNGQSLASENIFRIHIDEQDRLLLSAWGRGLQIYNPADGSFELFSPEQNHQSGIRSNAINDILPTPEGEYWIAGYKGLELFSPATKTFSSPALSIVDPIADLHLDKDGVLWIATDKNFIRYNPVTQATQIYSVADGLSNEEVVSIEQDNAGYLWLGTGNGLNRFDPRTKEFVIFDEHDGLAGSQFNRFSHLKTRDGLMYFGGTKGVSHFDPAVMPRNEYAPKIHITDIAVGQNLQQIGDSAWIDKSVNYIDELVLPYDQRDLTFLFTATNFISPTKNIYRYRLKGLEKEWTTVDSSRRRVRYNNLEHGTYQFQVLAANNDGVWAGSAKELSLVILPAWWQTWWARVGYLLLLFVAMYLFSYWRLSSNRRRQRQLELLIGEQTSRLKEANRSIIQLNTELEQRVEHRTQELSVEIEERRESEEKARYIAYHDALTGLYNRAWLLEHLRELVKCSSVSKKRFALFFVGGDRFRKINDTYGHLYGDKLLIAASQRLSSLLCAGQHAVRLGSDEFTLVIDCIESEDKVIALAERITLAFQEYFIIEQVRMSLSVSVGVVIDNHTYTEPAQILRSANIAMQRAKDRGRGVFQMFDEEILQETLDAAALEVDLKQALARNQFSVVYQPIVVIESGALSGFEILIRWQHPERGMVPPDKFIPMAESLGLIFDIGLWVLEKACQQLQMWQAEFNLPLLPTIAVNLSPVQLEHVDLLRCLDNIFLETGVDRENIKFEITESALMKHTDTVDGMLESLRERNIELAIDDFGTGYSSLSYLDKLPVQVLKIDRSFINALTDKKGKTGSAHEIVRATISLAHNLKMRVVAEGVETEEQLAALKSYSCDYGQGYFISRPLSPENATLFLASAKVVRFLDLAD